MVASVVRRVRRAEAAPSTRALRLRLVEYGLDRLGEAEDPDPAQRLAEEVAEVPQVAGKEDVGICVHRGREDGRVLQRQAVLQRPCNQRRGRLPKHFGPLSKTLLTPG